MREAREPADSALSALREGREDRYRPGIEVSVLGHGMWWLEVGTEPEVAGVQQRLGMTSPGQPATRFCCPWRACWRRCPMDGGSNPLAVTQPLFGRTSRRGRRKRGI